MKHSSAVTQWFASAIDYSRSASNLGQGIWPLVPSLQGAQRFHYTFNPVPINERPVDPQIFNNYFHCPHAADSAETWVSSFPMLEDASLYYGTKKLAKGWGIEIVEERRWRLLMSCNVFALLLSGGVSLLFVGMW